MKQQLSELSKKTGIEESLLATILGNMSTVISEKTVSRLPKLLEEIPSTQVKRIRLKLLYLEYPKAKQFGFANFRTVNLFWHEIGAGLISPRIFDLMYLSRNHPTVKRFIHIARKEHKLHTKEVKELRGIFSKFRKITTASNNYSWTRHPRMGKLSILQIDRLLETTPEEWHFNYPVKVKSSRRFDESLKPIEITLHIAEPSNHEIVDPIERNYLSKMIAYLENNKDASIRKLTEYLENHYKATAEIKAAIESTQNMTTLQRIEKVLAEHIKAYPKDTKRFVLLAMPVLTRGMKIPSKIDVSTIDILMEFYYNVIPDFFQRNNITHANPFEEDLQRMRNIFVKNTKKSNIRPVQFMLSPGKTILDAFPGATGQDCTNLKKSGQGIGDPSFHVIQIINKETGKNEGSIVAYERNIKGKKFLISNTMQPKARLLRQVNPKELFSSLVFGLSKIASQKGISHIASAALRGEITNRAAIDARIKAMHMIKIRPTRLFPDIKKHTKLYVLSSKGGKK